MDLRHLRYFIAVVEEKSFLRAAARLHISQPPLSTQIKELERALDATLLDRSPRGVELTAAGRVFYAEARSILARVEHAKIATHRAAHGEEGTLTIGFISIADYSVLPPALKQFRTRFPAIDVQLHELTTDAQIRELLAERIDIGIALAPVEDAGLTFVPLHSEKLMIAIPDDHKLAQKGGVVRLRDLADEQFVMVPRALAPGLHDLMLAFCRDCGFVPQVTQYAKQMQTVISLVSGGFGVALVPESLQNMHRTGVTYLQVREAAPNIQVGIIFRKNDRNPVINSFLVCTKEIAEGLTGKQQVKPRK